MTISAAATDANCNLISGSGHLLAQHELLHFARAVPGQRFGVNHLLGPLKAR